MAASKQAGGVAAAAAVKLLKSVKSVAKKTIGLETPIVEMICILLKGKWCGQRRKMIRKLVLSDRRSSYLVEKMCNERMSDLKEDH